MDSAGDSLERLRRLWSRRFPGKIDDWIGRRIGYGVVARLQVHWTQLPDYRIVDVHRAVERYCAARGEVVRVDSEHGEDLNNILHGKRPDWASRKLKMASKIAWSVGPAEEEYLPVDAFLLCKARSQADGAALIVRVRYDAENPRVILEAASDQANFAERSVAAIVELSAQLSIYRNKILELSHESGGKDAYGNIDPTARLRVLFKAVESVAEHDIVVEEEVRRILQRNVIDLHHRRDVLKSHRVPVRRGVLFYGPPGTGKTYACRYLCERLPDVTRIIVTGTALLQVSTIFSLARTLQPSLVILEDVDLVFASREINLYSSVLGELLDQMDGLRPYEDIGFILTTNAIERMESAIKDRPGRISQTVYFGPPVAELRRRYLQHYLRAYEPREIDLEALVRISNGATQAFLKEWVHRAVQIATERLSAGPVAVRTADFQDAIKEMKRYTPGTTGRIIGFHADGPSD
jgi:AAA+ superfamily predicted ATPase